VRSIPATGRPNRPERRLSGDQRRGEILAAALGVVGAQGYLPVPIEQVARAADVSKALVYAHFPTQAALCNALIAHALTPLAERVHALRSRRLEPLAAACARLYFDEVAAHGAVLNTLLTDPSLDRRRDRPALAIRDAIFRRLLRASRDYTALTVRQRTAALTIILATIEETGRLAQRGEMARPRARELCVRLVLSSIRGLRDLARS
jgi:AcrR family transcriptional regulator